MTKSSSKAAQGSMDECGPTRTRNAQTAPQTAPFCSIAGVVSLQSVTCAHVHVRFGSHVHHSRRGMYWMLCGFCAVSESGRYMRQIYLRSTLNVECVECACVCVLRTSS